MNIPKGMISVEEFSKKKGVTPANVIKMVKDGVYSGHLVGKQWYISLEENHLENDKGTKIKKSVGNSILVILIGFILIAISMPLHGAGHGNYITLGTFTLILGGLSIFGGFISLIVSFLG